MSVCLSAGSQTVNAARNEVYASVSMWGVNKEAAEAITHQQAWVCACVCVFGEGVKAREPPWHTYGCLSTNGGIDLEGKADRNEFWSTEGLHSACLSV